MHPLLVEAVATALDVDPAAVVPTARFIEDLGADSLEVLAMVMAVEARFHLHVPDTDVETFLTVGDVQAYLDTHLDHPDLGS